MASPFPGMDPYLERPGEWAQFHKALIYAAAAQLTARLPRHYRASFEEDLYLHEPSADERRRFAVADDAVVLEATPGDAGRVTMTAAAVPTTRMRFDPPVEVSHRFLEVRTADGKRVVSVVELLSPTNKTSGLAKYLDKREGLRSAGVNLLQVDLLRGTGPRLLPGDTPSHDYDAMLARADGGGEAEVWLWGLRDTIPRLPVPLAEGDADATLDLRAAADRVYDELGLARFIYARPPEPPLTDADAAWAAGLLRDAGVEVPAVAAA